MSLFQIRDTAKSSAFAQAFRCLGSGDSSSVQQEPTIVFVIDPQLTNTYQHFKKQVSNIPWSEIPQSEEWKSQAEREIDTVTEQEWCEFINSGCIWPNYSIPVMQLVPKSEENNLCEEILYSHLMSAPPKAVVTVQSHNQLVRHPSIHSHPLPSTLSEQKSEHSTSLKRQRCEPPDRHDSRRQISSSVTAATGQHCAYPESVNVVHGSTISASNVASLRAMSSITPTRSLEDTLRHYFDDITQTQPLLCEMDEFPAQQLHELGTDQWENKFVEAERNQDTILMRKLIELHEDGANAKLPVCGGSLLYHAACAGRSNSVKLLLDCGALLETHDRKYTPLFSASEYGHADVVKLLLQRGSNITGEFDFNTETALSIAAFKLCGVVYSMIGTDMMPMSNVSIRTNAPYNVPEKFNEEKFSFDLAEKAVLSALDLLKPSWSSHYKEDLLDELQHRLVTYVLLHDKTCIVRKMLDRMLLHKDAYLQVATAPATDYKWTEPLSITAQKLTKTALKSELDRLNVALKTTTEALLDWSSFPSLFVAQYRGLHMYTCHFSTALQREDYLRSTHLHRIAAAPAVYNMCSLVVGDNSLARESSLQQKAGELKEFFDHLPKEVQMSTQKHMSSKYADYLASIEEGSTNSVRKTLWFMKATAYPHVATSDLPYHALRYAAGLKNVKSLVESRLLPRYDDTGRPENPILGKTFICLLRPQQLAAHRVVHVSTEIGHELSFYIRPERETSITGAVQSQIVFIESVFRVPDLSQGYSDKVRDDYGLDRYQFDKYLEMAKADNLQGTNLDKFLDKVAVHMEKLLLQSAQDEALRRGGHLVYSPVSNRFELFPDALYQEPKSNSNKVSAHATFGNIYAREQKLMKTIGDQRFLSMQ